MNPTTHPTPIGPLTLASTAQGLVSSSFASPTRVRDRLRRHEVQTTETWLAQARAELDSYFAGTTTTFTVPVDLTHLSHFDQRVLAAVAEIPPGTTTTYGQLTTTLGLPQEDVRKVAAALARNPVPVFVPCHRVVGANGALTGYAGGLAAKRWLLDRESNSPQLALDLTGQPQPAVT